jgi:2-keto-4-pentenoate hydratase/2-oxohepta-3-ene-1,7-dioic acid hydratase in catechol pathway
MKLLRYLYNKKTFWGSYDIVNNKIHTSFDRTEDIHNFQEVIDFFTKAARCKNLCSDILYLKDVNILAPVLPTKNILCIGKNYYDHILEFDGTDEDAENVKDKPIFFSKAISSIIGPYSPILMHEGVTSAVDYEAELAVVIGKKGINIVKEDALEHVYGYTIINDVTARDLQKAHQQWLKGKSLDSYCPIGPWLVTKDEITNPQNLSIQSIVNGEIRQNSNTKFMIHNVAALIESLSRGMTLEVGDVIASGTPKGVGMGFDPPKFLHRGDQVEIAIEKIGSLINPVK